MQVRFVKSDDIWLSPAYDRDACHITLMIYNPTKETKELYFDEYYSAIRKYNPRVHWGKYFSVIPMDIEELYPRVRDFDWIRSKMDPKGIFLNRVMNETFGFDST